MLKTYLGFCLPKFFLKHEERNSITFAKVLCSDALVFTSLSSSGICTPKDQPPSLLGVNKMLTQPGYQDFHSKVHLAST